MHPEQMTDEYLFGADVYLNTSEIKFVSSPGAPIVFLFVCLSSISQSMVPFFSVPTIILTDLCICGLGGVQITILALQKEQRQENQGHWLGITHDDFPPGAPEAEELCFTFID